MAFVNFWKLPSTDYDAEQHSGGIFQCSDTGDTYIFGVLNSGSGGSDSLVLSYENELNNGNNGSLSETVYNKIYQAYQDGVTDIFITKGSEKYQVIKFSLDEAASVNIEIWYIGNLDLNETSPEVTVNRIYITAPSSTSAIISHTNGVLKDSNQVDPTLPSPYISEEDSSINEGTYVVKVDDVTPDQYILKIAGKTAKTSSNGIFTLTIGERQELSGTGIMYKPIQLMIVKDGKYSMPSAFQYGGGNIEYPELVQDIDPSIVLANIPEGICIIDGSGNIIPAANYSEWNEGRGLTGIGINSQGHKLVFGVADSLSRINTDDMKINTLKTWSQALSNVDIPGLAETTDSAIALQDFNSKANTDAILEALAISSNPSETNNAAVVCRNYKAGIIGKGLWDLPAAGTLNIIRDLRTDLDILIRVNMGKSYYYIFNDEISVSDSYTSTEYDTANVWGIGIDSEIEVFAIKQASKAEDSYRVIPVYTIK